MHQTVAIVTVTYNAASFIEEFLRSIAELFGSRQNYTLILVDNNSSDETCALIKSFISKHNLENRVTLIAQDTNPGFGTACNAGTNHASKSGRTELVWFLNPDTVISVEAADALLNEFTRNAEATFVGSVLKDEDGEVRAGGFRFPKLLNTISHHLKLGLFDKLLPSTTTAIPMKQAPFRVDWLTGASFMVKREVLAGLNGFDTKFFLYYEEVDLFLRAARAGYQAWSTPESIIFHSSGASTGINTRKQNKPKRLPKYWYESRRHFYIKNFGRTYLILLNIVLTVCYGLLCLRSLIQKKSNPFADHYLRDILSHS